MKYVIDTHIFLWLLFEPEKIPPHILSELKSAGNEVVITTIAFWEIALKYGLGKLQLQGVEPDELPVLAKEMGFGIESIDADTMATFYRLSVQDGHKDPFDRIVIWHCIRHGAILVSCDGKFSAYCDLGLKVLH